MRFVVDGTWENGGWVLQRLREDKQQPNDLRTAKRVVESIEDNLTFEDLQAQLKAAREAGTLKDAAAAEDKDLPRVNMGPLGGGPRKVSWGRATDASGAKGEGKFHGKGAKGK